MTAETKTELKARFVDGETISKADFDAVIDSLDLGSSQIYVAMLAQSGTNAPTITELRNTTGATVTPSRVSAGSYQLSFDNTPLTANKTAVSLSQTEVNVHSAAQRFTTAVITVKTAVTSTGALADDLLVDQVLIIRIFP